MFYHEKYTNISPLALSNILPAVTGMWDHCLLLLFVISIFLWGEKSFPNIFCTVLLEQN